MSIILIIFIIGFFLMAGFVWYINEDWSKFVDEVNQGWFELASHNIEEWAKDCEELVKKCDALQARIDELEGNKTL